MNILVVDDSFMMRVLISDLLREIPYVSEIYVAKSGMEALQKIKTLKINCIILDINMPGMDGLRVLKVIMKRYPTITILFSAYTNILVQHMDNLFINNFIERINRTGKVVAKLIEDREILNEGIVYCIPAGFAVKAIKKEGSVCLLLQPTVSILKHSPCIDDLMISISAITKKRTIGIILTGSGNDGLLGMKSIKQHGGKTIVQDESALVFEMPKAVIDAGVADFIFPLEKIPAALSEIVAS